MYILTNILTATSKQRHTVENWVIKPTFDRSGVARLIKSRGFFGQQPSGAIAPSPAPRGSAPGFSLYFTRMSTVAEGPHSELASRSLKSVHKYTKN